MPCKISICRQRAQSIAPLATSQPAWNSTTSFYWDTKHPKKECPYCAEKSSLMPLSVDIVEESCFSSLARIPPKTEVIAKERRGHHWKNTVAIPDERKGLHPIPQCGSTKKKTRHFTLAGFLGGLVLLVKSELSFIWFIISLNREETITWRWQRWKSQEVRRLRWMCLCLSCSAGYSYLLCTISHFISPIHWVIVNTLLPLGHWQPFDNTSTPCQSDFCLI